MIPVSTTTGVSVVDVTINKDYSGDNLYLVEATDGTVKSIANTIDLDAATANETRTLVNVEKASKFTDAALYNACFDTTAGNEGAAKKDATSDNDIQGIYYTDSTGAVHYKLLSALTAGQTITRGTDYVLICTQDGDVPTVGDSLEEYNTSDVFTAPYVMAPDTIKVTNRQNATNTAGWSAQLSLMGMDATWITYIADQTNAKIQLFDNTSVKNTGGKAFVEDDDATPAADKTAVRVIGGQAKDMYAAANNGMWKGTQAGQAVYAQFTAVKGIFGEEAIKLVSDAVETSLPAATSVTMTESENNPYDATVTFDGLRTKASGTVYIYQATDNDQNAQTIAQKGTVVGYAEVEGGTTSVEIEDIFDETQFNSAKGEDDFAVVFVPDDDETYATLLGNKFILAQINQGYALDDAYETVELTDANDKTLDDAIVGVDQFGGVIEAIDKSPYADIANEGEAGKMIQTTSANPGNGILTIGKTDGDDGTYGNIVLKAGAAPVADAFVAGTYRTINLISGQKLIITVAKNSVANSAVFNLSIQ